MSVPAAKNSRRSRKASTAQHLVAHAHERVPRGEPASPMVTSTKPPYCLRAAGVTGPAALLLLVRVATAKPTGDALALTAHAGVLRCPVVVPRAGGSPARAR